MFSFEPKAEEMRNSHSFAAELEDANMISLPPILPLLRYMNVLFVCPFVVESAIGLLARPKMTNKAILLGL